MEYSASLLCAVARVPLSLLKCLCRYRLSYAFSKERSRWYPFNVQMQNLYTTSKSRWLSVLPRWLASPGALTATSRRKEEIPFSSRLRSGRVGIWTPGLGVANAALFQLSYAPLTLDYFVCYCLTKHTACEYDIDVLVLWRLYGSLKWPC